MRILFEMGAFSFESFCAQLQSANEEEVMILTACFDTLIGELLQGLHGMVET